MGEFMNNFQISIRILLLAMIVALIIPTGSCAETGGDGKSITHNSSVKTKVVENSPQLEFFYDDDCESCIRVKPYIDSLKSAYPEMEFRYHNICSEVAEGKENLELFEKYKTEQSLNEVYVPVVFMGDVSLHGEKNITSYLQDKIQKYLGISSTSERVPIPTPTPVPANLTIDSEAVEFFFDEHNQPCLNILPYMNSLKSTYPEIRFNYHNVCGKSPENSPNVTLLDSFIRDNGITNPNIPLVTYKETIIIGDVNISRDLESLIDKKGGLSSPRITAPVSTPEKSIISIDSDEVDFFFDEHCEPCQKVMPHMNTMQSRYPGILFNYHNICGKNPENLQNRSTFEEMKTQKGLLNASVPLVSIGNTTIEGDNILTDLEPVLQTIQSSKSKENGSSLLEEIMTTVKSFFPQKVV